MTLTCEHCEYLRSQAKPDRALDHRLPPELHATIRTCTCDCRTPARIVGTLPKVVAA